MPMKMTGVLMTAATVAGFMTMIVMIAMITVMTGERNMKGLITAGSMRVFPSGLDSLPVFNK